MQESQKYLQFGKYTSGCPQWLLDKVELSGNAEHDENYVKEVLALIRDEFDDKKNQITTTTDFKKSRYINVADILLRRQNTCGSLATVVAAVLRSQNIPTKLIHGYYQEINPDMRHAWNEIYVDGAWQPFDITRKDFTIGTKHYKESEVVDWSELQ
jgi:transglutaminase-like putative cysteine protease